LHLKNNSAFLQKGLLMQKFHIDGTLNTPEIHLSPDENIFVIKGTSAPEDVRALYYPVIEWLNNFIKDILEGRFTLFTSVRPFKFKINLDYFNSSSAKFLFDIFTELKRLKENGIMVEVYWYHEAEDLDQKEAGNDIASLAGIDFIYIAKNRFFL
jgi:hypothetical protein